MRGSHLGVLSARLFKPFNVTRQCIRCLHQNSERPRVPSPTPFVPDVQTFLSLIGRGMSKHTEKLPSWEKLFTLSSAELRELGIEPTRQRRYLLRKREKFRNGEHGPGGDLDNVVDGVAQLKVVEVPYESPVGSATASENLTPLFSSATTTPGMRKVIVNLGPDISDYKHDSSNPIKKYAHLKIHQGSIIKGPFIQHIKGSNGSAALIKAEEGMWEDKQGHKIDGGERRHAEVRAKKRIEERRKGPA